MIGRSVLSLWATAFLLIAHPAIGQISDGVVKIGVMTDLSGPYSDFSGTGAVTAVQMAIEDFGSTVAGMPIELVSVDHQNKADISATRARKSSIPLTCTSPRIARPIAMNSATC